MASLKTYCAAAYRNIYSDNAGRYRLCCHASDHPQLQKYTTQSTSPFEFFMSEEMEDIREQMMSGERIAGCEGCYKDEDAGYISHRIQKYNSHPLPTSVDKVSLKLRIMGSYCNLSCYMCHPYNSSTRRIELKQKDILWTSDDRVVPISNKRYNEIVDDILTNIDSVDSIHITGGEPLQLPRMWQLMDKIPQDNAKDITLVIDTNLTVIDNVDTLIGKFKAVKLLVSCDHYGDKLAWIRYPIDINQFYSNLETLKHSVTQLNVTVSILNILDLNNITKWYKDFNVTFDNINENPSMLSVRNLPQSLKDKLISQYSKLPMVVQELSKTIQTGKLVEGIEYCQRTNTGRQPDFNQVFSNLLSQI
jgi:organic radical activating enzyme